MRIAALVLALVAGVIGLPASLCSGMCAAGLSAAAAGNQSNFGERMTEEEKEDAQAAGNVFMCSGLIGAVAFIAGGILVLRPGRIGAFACVAGTLLTALTLITFNPLSLLVLLIGGLATVFSFLKKDPVPLATTT